MKIQKDILRPKERMELFSKGRDIDRIPCSPRVGVTLSSIINKTTYEYYNNPEAAAEIEIAIFKKFGCDGAGVAVSLREVAEAMGSKLIYPENDISYLDKPAIDSINDVDKLLPADPYKDGKLPLRLKSLEIVNNALSREVNISIGIPTPFTTASGILGTDKFLKSLIKYPEKVHELLDKITESNFRIIDVIADMGVGFGMSDPISSSSLISPIMYKKFSMPYTKKCVDRMKQKTGKSTSIHVCGKSREIWNGLLETGISSISIDNVEDMEDAKKTIGDRVCIVGNVPPVEVMMNGTYEDTVNSAKECIRKSYDSPRGFILSTGCQVPLGSPIENVQALMDTVRSFGVYPVNPKLW
ncbi:uroporphyrinogen decarboxylase family protein [Clostridium tyrobutyricum]|uniref:uroporphyrinogen decarboxylase family protein n=1 Tax=Clostridium tyrobutyricum TaxID=1519 RepID=UPI0002D47BDB|nr:uroporphyrinogen decarboxylase family protein [Clostridium tyrobutyricum]